MNCEFCEIKIDDYFLFCENYIQKNFFFCPHCGSWVKIYESIKKYDITKAVSVAKEYKSQQKQVKCKRCKQFHDEVFDYCPWCGYIDEKIWYELLEKKKIEESKKNGDFTRLIDFYLTDEKYDEINKLLQDLEKDERFYFTFYYYDDLIKRIASPSFRTYVDLNGIRKEIAEETAKKIEQYINIIKNTLSKANQTKKKFGPRENGWKDFRPYAFKRIIKSLEYASRYWKRTDHINKFKEIKDEIKILKNKNFDIY